MPHTSDERLAITRFPILVMPYFAISLVLCPNTNNYVIFIERRSIILRVLEKQCGSAPLVRERWSAPRATLSTP